MTDASNEQAQEQLDFVDLSASLLTHINRMIVLRSKIGDTIDLLIQFVDKCPEISDLLSRWVENLTEFAENVEDLSEDVRNMAVILLTRDIELTKEEIRLIDESIEREKNNG